MRIHSHALSGQRANEFAPTGYGTSVHPSFPRKRENERSEFRGTAIQLKQDSGEADSPPRNPLPSPPPVGEGTEAFGPETPSLTLMELLAIRLGCPKTAAKSLLSPGGRGNRSPSPSGGRVGKGENRGLIRHPQTYLIKTTGTVAKCKTLSTTEPSSKAARVRCSPAPRTIWSTLCSAA